MSLPAPWAEVIRQVADELVAEAIPEEHGVRWMTGSVNSHSELQWCSTPGIYSGAAGIALFLLEAGLALGDARYAELALSGLEWAEYECRNSRVYSFYVGRLGVAFGLLRAAAVFDQPSHAERALRIADTSDRDIEAATVNELLGGLAGTLIGYLHLHEATSASWILPLVGRIVQRLAQNARWEPDGVCWDVRGTSIRGLGGLSHGTAGVAFALLETHAYTGDAACRSLAIEALRYDASAYSPALGGWRDYRKLKPGRDLLQQAAVLPDSDLASSTAMDAWCHGSAGVALSRLRALELLGDDWKPEAMRAVQQTHATLSAQTSFTLCHGSCGNATVFLEAARITGDEKYREWAVAVGDAAAEARRRGDRRSGHAQFGSPHDLSLLMGDAGTAHYLLMVDRDMTNVLLPRIDGRVALASPVAAEGGVMTLVAGSLAPETTRLIIENSAAAREFLSSWRTRDDVLHFLEHAAPSAGAGVQLSLETAKRELRESCVSYALAEVTRARNMAAGSKLLPPDVPSRSWKLAAFTRLWESPDDPNTTALLMIKDGDVVEFRLNPFSSLLLRSLARSVPFESLVRTVDAALDSERTPSEARVDGLIAEFLLEGAKAGIVVGFLTPHH